MTAVLVDQVRLGDHVCWTYDDESDALAAVGRFAATGLRLGQRVICLLDTLAPTAVRDAVGGPADSAYPEGRLRLLPATQGYRTHGPFLPDRLITLLAGEIAAAQQEGATGLRLVGDLAPVLRDGTPHEDLCRYEAQVNGLFPDGGVAGLCLYDRRCFPADWLRAVAAAHPATVGPDTARSWTPLLRAYRTTDPPGLRLVGQVDTSNRTAFAAVLADAVRRGPADHPVVLDLSGISFVDVGAAHLLAEAGRGGRGVRLTGCRPSTRRLLDLVRATDPTGLPA
ncbi:Anti-anti-sigma regulatory factor (antagonist of anti-sigma factor) [Micromonospora nigra]|uniref:Anti-anti-sigma regulatory factor (Antagonist of anti-sigma factor) n=1 Tax=Micromonospora nigra TaxID=145857 RepID=A0A1C6T4V0_9ACTN|nr:MEDS domain-containing protein [Micromonospora nigra]SCL36602.1 Anti-anti-sigma regulatory factor (antagonist of anti-sigma factor) [Micromonospora nigra]